MPDHRAQPPPDATLRPDRRCSDRHSSHVHRAWIGWQGPTEFRTTPAWLLDISLGGCLVATSIEPPGDRVLLIRLDGPMLPVWYETQTLSLRPDESHVWLCRLFFPDQCPYELFLATVYGCSNRERAARQPELPRFKQDSDRKPGDSRRAPWRG